MTHGKSLAGSKYKGTGAPKDMHDMGGGHMMKDSEMGPMKGAPRQSMMKETPKGKKRR